MTVRISPMRRRHIRSILKIEQVAYPRRRRPASSPARSTRCRGRGGTTSPTSAATSGYVRGLLVAPDSAHITNVAVDPAAAARASRRAAARPGPRRHHRRSPRAHARGARRNEGVQQLYRRFGFAAGHMRERYYEGHRRRHRQWAHDMGKSAFLVRLEQIERAIDGSTEWELT